MNAISYKASQCLHLFTYTLTFHHRKLKGTITKIVNSLNFLRTLLWLDEEIALLEIDFLTSSTKQK